jgi:hypothetical protein
MITSITLLNRRPRPDTVDYAQVAVYLTYAGQVGHAMIDLELYLPKSWTSVPARSSSGPDRQSTQIPPARRRSARAVSLVGRSGSGHGLAAAQADTAPGIATIPSRRANRISPSSSGVRSASSDRGPNSATSSTESQ